MRWFYPPTPSHPRVKKTLKTGLQWTRYQICIVIYQLCTSLVKAFEHAHRRTHTNAQSIPIFFLFTQKSRSLSLHVQHFIPHCQLWHVHHRTAQVPLKMSHKLPMQEGTAGHNTVRCGERLQNPRKSCSCNNNNNNNNKKGQFSQFAAFGADVLGVVLWSKDDLKTRKNWTVCSGESLPRQSCLQMLDEASRSLSRNHL